MAWQCAGQHLESRNDVGAEGGIAAGKKLLATLGLGSVTQLFRKPGQRGQASKETTIALMAPAHKATAPPAGRPQGVEASVITGARVCVGLDRLVGKIREIRPRNQTSWIFCGHLLHGRHRIFAVPGRRKRVNKGVFVTIELGLIGLPVKRNRSARHDVEHSCIPIA